MTEFLKLMSISVKPADSTKEARAAFKVFDRDNSGTISAEELRHVMRSLGESLTHREVDEMIAMADKDASGTIDCKSPIAFCVFAAALNGGRSCLGEQENL